MEEPRTLLLSDELANRLAHLVRRGLKTQAIPICQKEMNCTLREAKAILNRIEESLNER